MILTIVGIFFRINLCIQKCILNNQKLQFHKQLYSGDYQN